MRVLYFAASQCLNGHCAPFLCDWGGRSIKFHVCFRRKQARLRCDQRKVFVLVSKFDYFPLCPHSARNKCDYHHRLSFTRGDNDHTTAATTKFVVVIIVNNIDELPIIEYTQWQWFNGDDVSSHLNSTTNQKDYHMKHWAIMTNDNDTPLSLSQETLNKKRQKINTKNGKKASKSSRESAIMSRPFTLAESSSSSPLNHHQQPKNGISIFLFSFVQNKRKAFLMQSWWSSSIQALCEGPQLVCILIILSYWWSILLYIWRWERNDSQSNDFSLRFLG